MTKNKIIAIAIAAFVLTSSSITAQTVTAQTITANYSLVAEEPFSVKYLGSESDYLLFEVSIKLPEIHSAALEIADKEGELYKGFFKTDTRTTTVKIEKRDFDELTFKLLLGKNTYTKSFSVTTGEIENTDVKEASMTGL